MTLNSQFLLFSIFVSQPDKLGCLFVPDWIRVQHASRGSAVLSFDVCVVWGIPNDFPANDAIGLERARPACAAPLMTAWHGFARGIHQ